MYNSNSLKKFIKQQERRVHRPPKKSKSPLKGKKKEMSDEEMRESKYGSLIGRLSPQSSEMKS